MNPNRFHFLVSRFVSAEVELFDRIEATEISMQDTSHVELTELAGDHGNQDNSDAMATVATVAVVSIGAALFEAALLPGIVLDVAAMWLPRYYPKMGTALKPLFKSTSGADTQCGGVFVEFSLPGRSTWTPRPQTASIIRWIKTWFLARWT
jgi:hypothetical protein